jgi:predicted CopG family antitoxin
MLAAVASLVYASCMATKTITLELDAYERLRAAKRHPSESFSSVVRRAVFPGQAQTAGELLETVRARMERGARAMDEAVLDRLDEAQRNPRGSDSEW